MNNKKKVLFTATVTKHILSFHIPYLKLFHDMDYEVHVASNGKEEIPYCDKHIDISFERSPFKMSNFRAYGDLKNIIDSNKYEIVHSHTPVGGVITRLAARKARENYKTLSTYTAHGFHFYKGAPIKNWLLYYPIEKWLSNYTDTLITINQEDYDTVISKNFKSKKIVLVNGVGINLEKFQPQTEYKKLSLREEYGYDKDEFILIYAGELSYRKHQDLIIDAAAKLKDRIPKLKILLVGSGDLEEKYKKHIEDLDVGDEVKLLGFRKDIDNLMNIADLAVSASRQEGLPVNVMEAMATGLPLVVTDCRGNRDLVKNNENGYVVGIDDANAFANKVEELYKSEEKREKFSKESLDNIKKYSLENVLNEMGSIYSSISNE